MKVPFGTFTVAKGTFLTPPGRAAIGPFAALSAVKATFAALVAGAQHRERPLQDLGTERAIAGLAGWSAG
ncbi:hypothetical protein [Kutzneria albida]|uniref:hypothetical protein n=1 Tax=Kutzneria albida TaxID=43357 RepID=UPI0011DCDEB8|nr:hypothetical protein [Kutzneria albida]